VEKLEVIGSCVKYKVQYLPMAKLMGENRKEGNI
jgi:hypothetical protein